MRRPPSFTLAAALAVLAVAVACLADPDPRGGGLTPAGSAGRDDGPVPDPDGAGEVETTAATPSAR